MAALGLYTVAELHRSGALVRHGPRVEIATSVREEPLGPNKKPIHLGQVGAGRLHDPLQRESRIILRFG